MKTTLFQRIAITIPAPLLKALEKVRRKNGHSRSGIIQEAVKEFLANLEKKAMIAAYVEGYRNHPETKEEIDEANKIASRLVPEDEE